MFFKQLNAGGDRNYSYVVADTESLAAAVVDPGLTPEQELSILGKNNFSLKYIINTHDHIDHTGGNAALSEATGAQVAMHLWSKSPHNIDLRDGDILELGKIHLKIIHTPGHTPDSICILAGKELMTGDTLFVGKVGGTSNEEDARAEYDSLHHKIMTLPPDTHVWPGHDYGECPNSTIQDEQNDNPFILRHSFSAFLDLKENWLEYKKVHNIK